MLIKGDDIKLFLTDLCGRICYRPKGVLLRTGFDNEEIEVIGYDGHFIDFFRKGDYDQASIDLVRLYLRPMSSMTEEEEESLREDTGLDIFKCTVNKELEDLWTTDCSVKDLFCLCSWLNKHHFDYNGLIEKGFALEAPEGMYKNN